MKYPESFEDSNTRYMGFLKAAIGKELTKSVSPQALICSTHGNVMLTASQLWKESLGDTQTYFLISVNYCAIVFFKAVENSPESKFELLGEFCSSEHIDLGKAEVIPDEY